MIRLELCCFLVITTTSAFSLALIILMQLVEQFVFDNNFCAFFMKLLRQKNIYVNSKLYFPFHEYFNIFLWAWLEYELGWGASSVATWCPHMWPGPHIPSCVTPTTDISLCSGHCLNAAAMMSGILIIRCFFRLSGIHHSFTFIPANVTLESQ